MERIHQLLRGSGQKGAFSCFIDAEDLQDSLDKNWLLKEDNVKTDYTKFGGMRKINF